MIFTDLSTLARALPRSGDRRGVVVSSGFYDPLHVGHVAYLLAAGRLGDLHVAIVNGDAALLRKRREGSPFMVEAERAEIVDAVRGVDFVLIWQGDTVAEVLEQLQPAVFAKGGDRGPDNTPERATCERYGIRLVTGVGGGAKQQSSSALLARWGKGWA